MTLLVLVLASTALAVVHERRISGTITHLIDVDLERLWLISEVNEYANDGARKLIVLLSAPREQRVLAYTEIDASHRRLDSAMTVLATTIDGGPKNAGYRAIEDRLRRYREAYQDTADLVEADDLAAAQQSMANRVDIELSLLASATQSLDSLERTSLNQRLSALHAGLARDRHVLAGLGLFGGVLAIALAAWVTRGVAAPLRAVASAARQLASGQYGHPLPERKQGEVGDIVAAFNQLSHDVHQRELALRRLIDVDALTGLVQRDRFITVHGERVAHAARGGTRCIVACFDVERLKSINALLGFDAGDEAIVRVARRAESVARMPSGVARVGGGTFAILLDADSGLGALELAEHFRADMEHAFHWNGHTLDLAVSVGIAVGPDHGNSMADLLRRAEQALFDAKRQRAPTAAYSPTMEAARIGHLSLLSELQVALESGHLVPFLQPKVCLRTGTVVGAEALVRWRHPERGWIPPAEFIPFAEKTGRVANITRYMLTACISLMAHTLPGVKLAVNVSTYDLRDPKFVQLVRGLLAQHGVDPGRLQIEVTESGLMDSGDDPIQILAALRELGVGVSIDDFGTGQSSLAYLQRLPVDELKIDRSFVHGAEREPGRRDLLAAVVNLAHSLGLTVTAEGAETAGELALLRDLRCDLVQGYVINRPMPVEEFAALYPVAEVLRKPGRESVPDERSLLRSH